MIFILYVYDLLVDILVTTSHFLPRVFLAKQRHFASLSMKPDTHREYCCSGVKLSTSFRHTFHSLLTTDPISTLIGRRRQRLILFLCGATFEPFKLAFWWLKFMILKCSSFTNPLAFNYLVFFGGLLATVCVWVCVKRKKSSLFCSMKFLYFSPFLLRFFLLNLLIW